MDSPPSNTLGLIIGRFQPVHRGHLQDLILPAKRENAAVLILLGICTDEETESIDVPNTRNPFSFEARTLAIYESIERLAGDVRCVATFPVYDTLSDNNWYASIRELLEKVYPDCAITLYGSNKDDSTYYMDVLPTYTKIHAVKKVIPTIQVSATDIRKDMLEGKKHEHLVCTTSFYRLRRELLKVHGMEEGSNV